MLTPGSLVQNRYQTIRLLGQGGMGAVYQAQDLRLQRAVAVKENAGGDPRQFQQEAILLANLSHPNLPRVNDHFDLGNAQYLVMDFIEGEDLESILTRQGALPEAQALTWFDQILDAVAYLHSHGVIHRDIKPANIKITPQGRAVLVDFGIAKVFQPGRPTLTGAKAGTPGYASPEQYRGGTDQRSDIYSLGATLYSLVTGQTPPDALSLAGRSAMLMPPRTLNAALSAQTEQAIVRAMAIAPDQRFQSVDEMRRALVQIALAPTLPAPRSAPQTLPSAFSVKPRTGMIVLFVGVIVAVVFIGLLVGAFFVVSPMLTARATATVTRVAVLPVTPTIAAPPTPGVTNTPLPSPTLTRVPPTASNQIGAIRWELKDNSTGEVLAKGNSPVFEKDIKIEKRTGTDGRIFYNESIGLTPIFSVGLANFPENDKPSGFGMWLSRTDISTFSWDWFDIKDNQTATKIQGGGQLAYTMELVNAKWEITRIRFLTDVIFRAYPSGVTDLNNPKWTATFFRDSFINWPLHQ